MHGKDAYLGVFQCSGPPPSCPRTSSGLRNEHSASDRQPQPMPRSILSRKRESLEAHTNMPTRSNGHVGDRSPHDDLLVETKAGSLS